MGSKGQSNAGTPIEISIKIDGFEYSECPIRTDSFLLCRILHIEGKGSPCEGPQMVTVESLCGPERRGLNPVEIFEIWAGMTKLLEEAEEMPSCLKDILKSTSMMVEQFHADAMALGLERDCEIKVVKQEDMH